MSNPTNMQKLYKKYTDLQGENLELKEEISRLEAEIRDAIAVCNKNKEIHDKINFLEKKHRKELEELQVKYDALLEKGVKRKRTNPRDGDGKRTRTEE